MSHSNYDEQLKRSKVNENHVPRIGVMRALEDIKSSHTLGGVGEGDT